VENRLRDTVYSEHEALAVVWESAEAIPTKNHQPKDARRARQSKSNRRGA
jgi:hypothetical protein